MHVQGNDACAGHQHTLQGISHCHAAGHQPLPRTAPVSSLSVFKVVLCSHHLLQGPVQLLHSAPQVLQVVIRGLV